MKTAIYSHSFLAGAFNGNITPNDLDKSIWQLVYLPYKEYESMCSQYYKGHVDAMLEAFGQVERPHFLKSVSHYKHTFHSTYNTKENKEDGISLLLNVKNRRTMDISSYKYTLCSVDLYFFPLNTVFVALELDDPNTELNTLTASHYALVNWEISINSTDNQQLRDRLRFLADLLPDNNVANMIVEGTKMKMYQIVQTQDKEPDESLLYEIASFSPIGVVHGNSNMSPSKMYYEEMITNYSICPYKNWKALALNDSFTILSSNQSLPNANTNIINGNNTSIIENPSYTWAWPWINLYFPLIYLRCIFEKNFCQSRNIAYRQNKTDEDLFDDILEMEKYYFYNNISYNFLPTLLYTKMAYGMGIPEERDAILKQIKDRLREKQNNRNSYILAVVSIFAVFSIAWDFCSILNASFPCLYDYLLFSVIMFIITILAIISLTLYIFSKQISRWIQELKTKKGKSEGTIKYTISDERMEHIKRHFSREGVGSKFDNLYTPKSIIDMAIKMYPLAFLHSIPDTNGKRVISIKFPFNVGTCNVVSRVKLNEDELSTLELKKRNENQAWWVVTSEREFATTECQLIFTFDWQLITMFPGELAPPLPATPDIHDEYWDNHVFIIKKSQKL